MDKKTRDGFPNFVDLLLDAVFMVDANGLIVYVSAACERILGYTPDEMIGMKMIELILPEDRARTMEEAAKVMAGQPRIGFENRYLRKDGRIACIMWSARWSEADQLRIGVARDITERKRAEELQAAMYAISEAAHMAVDLAALFRDIHQIIAGLIPVSSFAVAMRNERTGQIEFSYQLDSEGETPQGQQAATGQICAEVIRSGQPLLLSDPSPALGHDALASSSGNESWLAVPLFSQTDTIGAVIVKSHFGMSYTEKDKELFQFVSKQVAAAVERKQLHTRLLEMAQFDELTGLPNRRVLYDRIEVSLAKARRDGGQAAVLYIDLDDFKQINDSLGHAFGDLVLQEAGRRLKQTVRKEDTVARLGGDEFVVLLDRIQQSGDAAIVAEKIGAAFSQQTTIEGKVLNISPSIGIALFPEHGDEVEQLLNHADEAMYLAKKTRISTNK